MSYAQVIVRFANVSDPSMHTGRTTSIYLGSSRYAFLTGYEAWDQAAQGASAFSIHTSASATANSYRQKFLAAYGPNGSLFRNDLTVSPVMVSTDPSQPYYIVIDFNYYVGENVTVISHVPLYMSVTQEVIAGFEVTGVNLSAGASCDLANFALSVSGGTAPYVVTRGGQL